ncbi:hypothetical protein [Solimonas aquatica]|uniref:hypothetical protein n=1 Tax=Solimonas aquatica TaxID=489703 RepID=UPI0015A5F627|nr:hypothetical protein [Solimonas aquatica]
MIGALLHAFARWPRRARHAAIWLALLLLFSQLLRAAEPPAPSPPIHWLTLSPGG